MSNNIKSYSSLYNFTKSIISLLIVGLVGFLVAPKVYNAFTNIKINNAIDSVYSYQDNIKNYYVSQLISNYHFKFDGYYEINDGSLVSDNNSYDIYVTGSVPKSGYLDYQDNVIKSGCVVIGDYSLRIMDGQVTSVSKDLCDSITSVAYNN